jgi:hypothetical protein
MEIPQKRARVKRRIEQEDGEELDVALKSLERLVFDCQ